MSKPPIPLFDSEENLLFLYPEEKEAYEKAKEKKMPFAGLLRPFYRALGWIGSNVEDEGEGLQTVNNPEPLQSTKLARRKKSGGLFEK